MEWSTHNSWPNAELSRQVRGPVHLWHVQESGKGPLVLLLHGAGGSVHSYAGLIPLMAEHFQVVAIDLPGHGFTRMGPRNRSGLPQMADDIWALCQSQGWMPDVIVGHSAGGAIALEISRRYLSPRGHLHGVVGINAALGAFKGVAGVLFPALAKLLTVLPFSARLFASASQSEDRIHSLITSTGSELDSQQIALYRQLASDSDHVKGAMQMMAQWQLDALLSALPDLPTPCLLIASSGDKTVPASVSKEAAEHLPNAQLITIPDLGHLVHEEDPDQIAEMIRDFADHLLLS